ERHRDRSEYIIFVIGRKGRDYFKRLNMPVAEEVIGLHDNPAFADIRDLARMAVSYFEKGECDELYLVFNQFINAIQQVPVEKKLLPLQEMKKEGGPSTSYEYEPSPEKVLDILLPKYIETLIYSAVLESKASEFGARMTAMGNATNNASDIISQLTLTYNRARQAAITQEITEIVAGANAQV
ncbi:MAG: ATP synthase F1 subunit gamma, partial [Paenibacillus sp. RIFOXYA1_FULL_44_5]